MENHKEASHVYNHNNMIAYSSFLESLVFLNKYKNLLHITASRSNDNMEYCTEEIQRINDYIKKWCSHEMVIDYFETDVNVMEKVKYCKHCENEFE